uniref:Uncharacterized protein n=1 Tax=Candidatus Kentrum sp. DK TaxID=2126562 RepID=A0A450TK88_9GAMM|nr:MAG: hypothetical protein BECKDK2373C_GA0170839_11742 [Candidatus Kentron sp. DK]
MSAVRRVFLPVWNNIHSLSSMVAVLVTVVLAVMALQQNARSLQNQITIEQMNVKHADLDGRFYRLMNDVEANASLGLADVVSGYAAYRKDPKQSITKPVADLRNILFDTDRLAYDILAGYYNVDIALPILTGFFAKLEAAISSVAREKRIIIRKSTPYYTYLQRKHLIPYRDRKRQELQSLAKELDGFGWDLPPVSREGVRGQDDKYSR